MKRGAGRQLQAALHSHNYANGGMVPGYADGGVFGGGKRPPPPAPLNRFAAAPRPRIADPNPMNGQAPLAGMSPQQFFTPGGNGGFQPFHQNAVPEVPVWTPPTLDANGHFTSQSDIDDFKAAFFNSGYDMTPNPGSLQGARLVDAQAYKNNKAAGNWAQGMGFWHPPAGGHGGLRGAADSFGDVATGFFKEVVLSPPVLAAVGAYAFPGLAASYGGGVAGAAGAGATIGAVPGLATGNYKNAAVGAATGAALGGAGAAMGGGGGNPQLENFSSVPQPAPTPSFGQMASGATSSTVPSGFTSGPSFMGAGMGAGSGATDPYSDPEWQRANSSQMPSQFAPQSPQMSPVPPPNMGIGTGDAPFDFGIPSPGGNNIGANRWSGMDVSGVNPDYVPQQSMMPSSEPVGAARYTNAGFNADAGSTTMPYGDFGDMSGGVGDEITRNPFDTTPRTQIQGQPSVLDRINSGLQDTVRNLPENIGRAIPGMAIGLGAKLIGGSPGGGGGGNDQALQAQQAQTATDAARNDIALNSQKEFAANASKFGNEGYYNQMGDMAGMQFQAQRAQQRADMARQLQARGSDPATIAAIMRQYDMNTTTGASGARNNAYLSARDRGLAAQQAAAGMYPSGSSPVNQSNIADRANTRADNTTRDITDLVSQPFIQAAKRAGSGSGQALQDAGDAAAQARGDRTGLNSTVFGRG